MPVSEKKDRESSNNVEVVSTKPNNSKGTGPFTILLATVATLQFLIIAEYVFGPVEVGIPEAVANARFNALLDAQEELIRSLRIEIKRLKNR